MLIRRIWETLIWLARDVANKRKTRASLSSKVFLMGLLPLWEWEQGGMVGGGRLIIRGVNLTEGTKNHNKSLYRTRTRLNNESHLITDLGEALQCSTISSIPIITIHTNCYN